MIALARRIATHTVFNVPVASQRVALAALRAPPLWIDSVRARYREARDLVVSALPPGLRASSPEGGSYVFVDFAPTLEAKGRSGPPARNPARTVPAMTALLGLAIDHGVALAPGDGFGDAFGSWARLCFTAVPPARLKEGLARLEEAMRHWTASSVEDSD